MKTTGKFLLITCLAMPLSTLAESPSLFAFGVNGGSRGLGFDATVKINSYFNLRGSYSQYEISESFDEDDIEYDGDLELDTMGVMLDYYPFAGSFRLSAGYFNNGNQINAKAQPGGSGTVNINGFDYDVSNEWVKTEMDWDSSTSYLGLGWGNAFGEGSNWTFTFDLGLLLTDEPSATLSASDGLHASAATLGRNLQADLDAEAAELNDDLSDFDKYPVIQLGLSYRF